MASRNSAYFHLLSSNFLTSAAVFVADTCGALDPKQQQQIKQKTNERLKQKYANENYSEDISEVSTF